TLHVDASLKGIGIWDNLLRVGYHYTFPPHLLGHDIFVYEALAVVSALHLLSSRVLFTRTVNIFSDSSNTVSLFNFLRASYSLFNDLLKFSVDILLREEYQLRVLHIAGENNHVADALSRQQFPRALQYDPDPSSHLFQHPQDALGALKK
ncbi:hypothetical protein BDQ17DRAFT_1250323, partial [Cyathus striatus]